MSATGNGGGLGARDMAWLLARAPAEVLILRPAPDDARRVTTEHVHGHW